MKIALVGYGKMGRMIERIAVDRGHEVTLRLDEFNNANFEGITRDNFEAVDVAIDFSIPAAAVQNIERIAALGVNLVVGTTGWQDRAQHSSASSARRRNYSPALRNMKPGRGRFITQPRKTLPPGRS